jgi:hypothetical protein
VPPGTRTLPVELASVNVWGPLKSVAFEAALPVKLHRLPLLVSERMMPLGIVLVKVPGRG